MQYSSPKNLQSNFEKLLIVTYLSNASTFLERSKKRRIILFWSVFFGASVPNYQHRHSQTTAALHPSVHVLSLWQTATLWEGMVNVIIIIGVGWYHVRGRLFYYLQVNTVISLTLKLNVIRCHTHEAMVSHKIVLVLFVQVKFLWFC